MRGINLNRPVIYRLASLRYFQEGEYHVTRFCMDDVLILVFEGILRFTEDGIPYEVGPGKYHIQKSNTFQSGGAVSDAPKYLYVHFNGEWTDSDSGLPFEGDFDYITLRPIMEKLSRYYHENYTYIEQTAEFFELLSMIYQEQNKTELTLADKIADFLEKEYLNEITLEKLAEQFHYSKNHIINTFRRKYGLTPFSYIGELKLKRAEYLLVVTSDSLENISELSGFHTYSQFYRLFVRKNGISPVRWRQMRQN